MTDIDGVQISLRSLIFGVLVGAAASTAGGIWWTLGGQAKIEAEHAAERAQIDDLVKTRSDLRDRVLTVETRLGPYIATSDELLKLDRHASALDGRGDAADRRMNELDDRISDTRARLDAIARASNAPLRVPR
jgi:hypothetical protein